MNRDNKDTNSTVLSAVVVCANTPKEFDIRKHRVIKFTRKNYKGYYTQNIDGYYTYKGESSAESSIHYSEDALLAYDNITVVAYNCR